MPADRAANGAAGPEGDQVVRTSLGVAQNCPAADEVDGFLGRNGAGTSTSTSTTLRVLLRRDEYTGPHQAGWVMTAPPPTTWILGIGGMTCAVRARPAPGT